MIWEVDETLDKTVSYLEFNLMYRRIRQDTESVGMEPRKLFVVCDYMMNDKNGDGVVAMDEAVQLMFMRYGKSFSQDEIKSVRAFNLSIYITSCQLSTMLFEYGNHSVTVICL